MRRVASSLGLRKQVGWLLQFLSSSLSYLPLPLSPQHYKDILCLSLPRSDLANNQGNVVAPLVECKVHLPANLSYTKEEPRKRKLGKDSKRIESDEEPELKILRHLSLGYGATIVPKMYYSKTDRTKVKQAKG